MQEVSKRIKPLVREWAAIAHDRDLSKALSELRAQFDRWERGEINAFELNELVHQFHQGDFAGDLEEIRDKPPRAGNRIGRRCRCASQRGATRGALAAHHRFDRILRTRSLRIMKGTTGRKSIRPRMGTLPPRYSFVLNPHRRERFTRCANCEASTRIRKIPLVVHVDDPNGPRLVLLNKSCRLCLGCETLIVDQAELELVITAGLSAVEPPRYLVLGTIDRRTWRNGLVGGAQLADIRAHMADFKKHLKVEVVPAHWGLSTRNAG